MNASLEHIGRCLKDVCFRPPRYQHGRHGFLKHVRTCQKLVRFGQISEFVFNKRESHKGMPSSQRGRNKAILYTGHQIIYQMHSACNTPSWSILSRSSDSCFFLCLCVRQSEAEFWGEFLCAFHRDIAQCDSAGHCERQTVSRCPEKWVRKKWEERKRT